MQKRFLGRQEDATGLGLLLPVFGNRAKLTPPLKLFGLRQPNVERLCFRLSKRSM